MKKRFLKYLFAITVAFCGARCTDDFSAPDPADGETLYSIASADENLDIFQALADKTGLSTSLVNNNSGSYTVFAPNDNAFVTYFQSLSPDYAAYQETEVLTLIGTLSSSTVPTLSTVTTRMTYHFVTSEVRSTDMMNGQVFTTLNGARLSISKTNSTIFLNANVSGSGAKVASFDTRGSNGVLHVVDRFMSPPSSATVLAYIQVINPATNSVMNINYGTNPPTLTGGLETGVDATETDTDIFAYAIRKGGVASLFVPNVSPVPDVTVFAPTDKAFKTYFNVATEAEAVTAIKNMPADEVAVWVKTHVVKGRYTTLDLSNGLQVMNLREEPLTFTVSGATIKLTDLNGTTTDATITGANNLTNTGVVHKIDTVLGI
jgi:uncharacterized surface protein with fasciclin (FAS1) repeats